MGDAVQEILNPLVKLVHPEIEDMWSYYEAGFVNLVVASVRSRYNKEPLKTALGLFGSGQIALTKCVILVGPGVDVRDFNAVLREVRKYFRAEEDFLLLPRVPLDTLDFTSYTMHTGSKMAMDATPKEGRPPDTAAQLRLDLARLAPEALGSRLIEDTLLAVQVPTLPRASMSGSAAPRSLRGSR